MSIAQQLKAVQKEAKEAQKALQLKLQESFTAACQSFFEKVPEGTTLMWAQYTDYFNDGDPCTFSVHSVTLRGLRPWTEEELEEWGEDELESYQYDEISQYDALEEHVVEDFKALSDFIERQEDLMEKLYGDHVLVKLTKEGAEITPWDHN